MRKAVGGRGGAVAARSSATSRAKQPIPRAARPVSTVRPATGAARTSTTATRAGAKAPPVTTTGRLTLVRPPAPVRPLAVVRPPAPPDPAHSDNPFFGLLLAKRQELSGNLEDTKFDTRAKMGRVAEDDQAQISHEEFISLQRNSMDYQALRLVNAAIERLNSGDYGVCASCDEPISEKRLKAIPWAKYCVTCQDRVHANGGIDENSGDDSNGETW